MTVQRSTAHERFNAFIGKIKTSCKEKVKKENSWKITKNVCEKISNLCDKYNNSIHSLQGHNKRVVARAYAKQMTHRKDFYTRVGAYKQNKKAVAADFYKSSSLDTANLTKKELQALY